MQWAKDKYRICSNKWDCAFNFYARNHYMNIYFCVFIFKSETCWLLVNGKWLKHSEWGIQCCQDFLLLYEMLTADQISSWNTLAQGPSQVNRGRGLRWIESICESNDLPFISEPWCLRQSVWPGHLSSLRGPDTARHRDHVIITIPDRGHLQMSRQGNNINNQLNKFENCFEQRWWHDGYHHPWVLSSRVADCRQ